MRFDFGGKTAVVTGGASGIGLATVTLLRESGAQVHVLDREVDVSSRPMLEAAMLAVAPFDIVVANAGIGSQAELTETTEDLWNRTVAVNLTGVFHTVQLAALAMKPRRTGAIVLTASTNSYDGEPRLTAYNATKAGVLG
ncbi:MAG: SDR family oxidoreductase, partial [Acidobacteriota bacterium]|nr:SDR family oxidoreductase [Acidobacteriota bacterium]